MLDYDYRVMITVIYNVLKLFMNLNLKQTQHCSAIISVIIVVQVFW